MSPTAGSGAACTHGGDWHREPRNTDLHSVPIPPLLRHHSWTSQKTTPAPSRTQFLVHAWLYAVSVVLGKAESRAGKQEPLKLTWCLWGHLVSLAGTDPWSPNPASTASASPAVMLPEVWGGSSSPGKPTLSAVQEL